MALEGDFCALKTSASTSQRSKYMTEKKPEELKIYNEYLPRYKMIEDAIWDFKVDLSAHPECPYEGPMELMPDWIEELASDMEIMKATNVDEFIDDLKSDLGNEEDANAFVIKYFNPDEDVLFYLEREGL